MGGFGGRQRGRRDDPGWKLVALTGNPFASAASFCVRFCAPAVQELAGRVCPFSTREKEEPLVVLLRLTNFMAFVCFLSACIPRLIKFVRLFVGRQEQQR